MNRLLAILVSPFFLLLAPAAQALTLTPLPGSAGQATQMTAFFPNTLGVTATDDVGRPAAGVHVVFSAVPFTGSNGFVFFAGNGFSFSNAIEVVTGDDGVALALPGPIGFEPGATGVIASANHASPVTIPLAVVAGGTTRIEVVSGSHQVVPAGRTFAQPWIAQAFDASGATVPYAAILFHCPDNSGSRHGASCEFGDSVDAWARADANGIAISPFVDATHGPGHDEGVASTLNPMVTPDAAFFAFTVLPEQAGAHCDRDNKAPVCGR